jgi:hypothetical protein
MKKFLFFCVTKYNMNANLFQVGFNKDKTDPNAHFSLMQKLHKIDILNVAKAGNIKCLKFMYKQYQEFKKMKCNKYILTIITA